jgi:prepilin-type N-terminal cleavage/methylation domain-containing protein
MKLSVFSKQRGFSLIELAIVVTVIGIILAMVVRYGGAILNSSKVVQTLAIIDDLSKASVQFKEQYKSLPGDMLVSSTTPEITGLPAACMSGGAEQGNGNESITADESACVIEHLYHAGFIKSDGVNAAGLLTVNSPYGTIRVISRASSVGPTLLGRNVSTVIELANLPCDVVQEIDRKSDNDNIGTGNVVASTATGVAVTTCNIGDIVPFLLVPL